MRVAALWLIAFSLLPFGVANGAVAPSAALGLAPPDSSARIELPARDHSKLLEEDLAKPRSAPLRYAIGEPVAASSGAAPGAAKALASNASAGQWQTLPDGRELWRLAVRAPGAVSLDFGFKRMFLPHGAELYLSSADGKHVLGPYTDADNTRFGGFWTPVVQGEETLIELTVPAELKRFVVLELGTVNHAYRDLMNLDTPSAKSLSCEIDVACPEGDAFRDQIRAVGRYGFSDGGSAFLCTGQLLNNTAGDRRKLFHSANHCVSTEAAANTVVVYWNYQSATCRTPGSVASGTPLPTSIAVVQAGGATLRANYPGADATLMELLTAVPPAANVFFDGWDRRDTLPESSAVIHHANGDEKRITLDADAPVINAASVSIGSEILYDPSGSIDVTYDRGTTEGGSSGAGLLTPQGRVVGQIGGGPDGSCSTGITDTYGRLVTAWEGGGAPTSRFRDWLDAGNIGAQTLDGSNNCPAPTIGLSGPATGQAGQALTFTVSPSGSGPFRVSWDVDGDGVFDRTVTGVTGPTSLPVSFPAATQVNLRVHVVDATGCSGDTGQALIVNGPGIGAAPAGQLQQLCGNNDNVIDPGERWNVPVLVFNGLSGAQLNGGYAIFARPYVGTALTVAGPDPFGYIAADDDVGCGYDFIELEGQVSALPLTAAPGTTSVNDDAASAPQLMPSFDFYGVANNALVMSTNGYLSTSNADTGGEFDNACGLALPTDGSAGARFNVLHDDLLVSTLPLSGLRQKNFASCPRQAESIAGAAACTVYQWSHVGQFSQGGPIGDATFEAVIYPATGEIVYQYRTPLNDDGASATVGIQNEAATSGVEYSCNRPAIRAKRAICFFHPGQPPLTPPLPAVRIENPAIPLPNLSAGANTTVNVMFDVRSDAACGTPLKLNYVGTVDAASSSMAPLSLVDTTAGGGGTCHVANGCNTSLPAPITLADGVYFNASRSGNGEGVFTIPIAGSERPTVFSAWFTGSPDRTPTWYIVQDFVQDNQMVAPVYRFQQDVASPTFKVSKRAAGTAQMTWLAPSKFAFTWNLGGVPGGQIEQRAYQLSPATVPNRTGAWFYAAEGGWGQVIDDHFLPPLTQTTDEVAINYLYDSAGNPRWNLGDVGTLDTGTIPLTQFQVHCPSCPKLVDFLTVNASAGTLTRNYTSVTTGVLSTQITFQPPLLGNWNRTSIPIQMISVPPAQSPCPGPPRRPRARGAARTRNEDAMLRELILLRHAKAEPLTPGGTDFERRLTTQGEHDAERIGTLLAEAGAKPTRALSSPAPRAQATAERALAALGKAPLETDPEIFDATPSALLEVLARHRDAAQVLLVGHNPGISELASLLLHGRSEESRALPTAGYAWLSLRADTPLEPGTATLTRYGSARG